ncbi:MAG: metalloregulator ArsR/SmtB family transcription factor [Endomicrobiales bacterium]|nr:metalloregulator ArsR/SmtB family transcription factor [Endomicrobiales bacterium]
MNKPTNYTNVFSALSDKTRLRIMCALICANDSLCICELMDTLKLKQYNISRHVKELKTAGLVLEKRAGKFVFYSITKADSDFGKHIIKLLKTIKDKVITEDAIRLKKRLAIRKEGKCIVGMSK